MRGNSQPTGGHSDLGRPLETMPPNVRRFFEHQDPAPYRQPESVRTSSRAKRVPASVAGPAASFLAIYTVRASLGPDSTDCCAPGIRTENPGAFARERSRLPFIEIEALKVVERTRSI